MDENRASCIMPWTEAEGWVDFEISLDGGPFYWKGSFFVGKLTLLLIPGIFTSSMMLVQNLL